MTIAQLKERERQVPAWLKIELGDAIGQVQHFNVSDRDNVYVTFPGHQPILARHLQSPGHPFPRRVAWYSRLSQRLYLGQALIDNEDKP